MHRDVDVNNILHSGHITQGPCVEQFEKELEKHIQSPYVVSLNSGTSALALGLQLMIPKTDTWPGFDKESDVVLTPALTCFATTCAILSTGCRIKWLDVDKQTANVSLDDLRAKLAYNTKVVYIVHWGGYPVDLDKLEELKDEHYERYGYRFMVVEDCAHAFGATYKSKPLGNHGNICAFSFQAIKHLTCGDGGALVLPSQSLYERAKLLRWFGIDRDKRNGKGKDFRLEDDILEAGFKYHMNDINATIGLQNLPHVQSMTDKCRANSELLFRSINNPAVRLSENRKDRNSACWLFTIFVENKPKFIDHMKSREITVSQVHNRNDLHSCVAAYKCELPNLDQLERELVCIPCGWWLSSTDLVKVIDAVNSFDP